MEFSELLAGEHKPIRQALKVLESMRDKIQRRIDVDIHDVNAILVFLHCFADGCHQAKEESILFPALRKSLEKRYRSDCKSAIAQIESLLEEHKHERDLIEKTQLALFTKQGSDFAEHARKLIDLISEHANKEERVLFPMAEKILTEQEAMAVSGRIHEANATFGEYQIKLLLDMLNRLEERFISKAA